MFDISTHIHSLKRKQIISWSEISATAPVKLVWCSGFYSRGVCVFTKSLKNPSATDYITDPRTLPCHSSSFSTTMHSQPDSPNRTTTHRSPETFTAMQKASAKSGACQDEISHYVSWRIIISRNRKRSSPERFESLAKQPLSVFVSSNSNKMVFCLHFLKGNCNFQWSSISV